MELQYSKEIKSKSPISKILSFNAIQNAQNLIFQFCYYTNANLGYGITEYRNLKECNSIRQFYKELNCLIEGLTATQELAFSSLVINDGKMYHIPLIDFFISNEEYILSGISKLQEYYNFDVYLFKSGRSYHGYMDALLPSDEWLRFLGQLLLLNRKVEIIDAQWVGHSLKQGFSSLRLSCNTPVYISYPIYSGVICKTK